MSEKLQRILYVEDDPDIRAVAKLVLELDGGFEVAVCASGREAVSRARNFAPDLIMLDVMMPEMDGPTTLVELRGIPELRAIPAVYMTARTQPAEIDQLLRLGAKGVIAKPFDPMTLVDQVRVLWSEVN